jgi:small subunit ribosomal protein S6
MQKYEIMAIIANDLKEKDAEKYATEEICALVKNSEGTMTFEDFWGERGFAYKINKEKWGFYFVGQFEIEPAKIETLKREWNLSKKIVRFLITKVDSKSPAAKKYDDVRKENIAQDKKKVIETESKVKKSVKKEKPNTQPISTEVVLEKATKPKKDAIDKKLGEILADSSLDL